MTFTLLKIGSFVVPKITAFSLSLADLDSENTGRSESGYMSRDVIRKDVASLSLSCRLTDSELDQMTEALKPDAFQATFRAPVSGGKKTAKMYAGDRSMTLVSDTPSELWDFSVNLIEY